MSEQLYKIPDNYEDAVKRKFELLEIINKYNEALLLEQELPCTEEEIEQYQEEYQILNDHLALTKEEKINKLNDKDKEVLEDGTVVEKKSVFDDIHISIYFYTIFSTILATGVFNTSIADKIIKEYVLGYFEKIYKATSSLTLLDADVMHPVSYWAVVSLSYFFIPLLIMLLSFGFYMLFRKGKKINKRITFFVMLFHIVLGIVVMVVLGVKNFKTWADIYDNIQLIYSNFVYGLSSGGY